MGNFKRDSAGGKAVGQMCEGKGSGDAGMSRDEALHAVTPGRYVDLTLDAGFKAVFADKGNKELLIGLLNVLLPPEARVGDILEYLDRETGPDFLGGKSTRMDLVCRGEDGRRFIVEMQREPETAFFERCVYYGSGVYRGTPQGREVRRLAAPSLRRGDTQLLPATRRRVPLGLRQHGLLLPLHREPHRGACA